MTRTRSRGNYFPRKQPAESNPAEDKHAENEAALHASEDDEEASDVEANEQTRKVIEYLNKKGYSKTEAVLRAESANQEVDMNSIISKPSKTRPQQYIKAFGKICRNVFI